MPTSLRRGVFPETRGTGRIVLITSFGDSVDRLLGSLETGPLATDQLQKALGLKHRPTFKENYLKPALAERLIEMTIPDKPSSRLQKYRLTHAGRARLTTKHGGTP